MLPFRRTALSAGASALLLVSSSATAKELIPDPVVPHAPAELSGGAYFGGALAAAGALAVAGAPLANTDVGSAWSLGVVQQEWSAKELVPLAPPAEGYFLGSAVAIDQQGAIAVAMPGAGTGKVMVFENDDVTDLQVTLGTTSTLGSSLALSQGLLLVGDQTSKSCMDGNCGAVFQFQNLGGWKQVGEPILASTPVTGQKFGAAIALFAGDPVTAAIGAPGDIVDTIATGAVYLMHDDKVNGWIVQRLASPPGLIDGDEFGSQVALSEQWVLATTFDSGHVYAFDRITDEMWISLDALVKSGGSHRSVTIAGDLAAIGDYDANDLDGAVTVLTIEGGDFSFLSQLNPPQMGLLGRFGLGATLDGETLWIGEPGNGAGHVYRFVVKSSPGEQCGDDEDCASGQCSMEICSDPSNETTGEPTTDTGSSTTSSEDPSTTTSLDPTGTSGGVTTTTAGGSEGGVGVDLPDLFDGCECRSTGGSTSWLWFSLLLLARGRRRLTTR